MRDLKHTIGAHGAVETPMGPSVHASITAEIDALVRAVLDGREREVDRLVRLVPRTLPARGVGGREGLGPV